MININAKCNYVYKNVYTDFYSLKNKYINFKPNYFIFISNQLAKNITNEVSV